MPNTHEPTLTTNIAYPNHEPVTLQSALNLATSLNLINIVQGEPLATANLIINALCEWAVGEDTEPFDFRPYDCPVSVFDLLWDAGWDVDWYDLLSGYTQNAVEANITELAKSLIANEPDAFIDRSDAERKLRAFTVQWRQEVAELIRDKARP